MIEIATVSYKPTLFGLQLQDIKLCTVQSTKFSFVLQAFQKLVTNFTQKAERANILY